MIAKASLYNCVGEFRIDLEEYLTNSQQLAHTLSFCDSWIDKYGVWLGKQGHDVHITLS